MNEEIKQMYRAIMALRLELSKEIIDDVERRFQAVVNAIPPEIQRALEGEMEEVFILGNDHSVCACDCVAMAGERVLIVYYKPAKEEE